MGTRLLLFLIFFCAVSSFACDKCHKPHYETVGTCSVCHRGNMDSSRKNIAHEGLITSAFAGFITDKKKTMTGETLVSISGCRRCHKIGGKGSSSAADLSLSASKRDGLYLADKIKNVNLYMPDFHFNDREIASVVTYLFSVSDISNKKSEPYTAYIVQSKKGVFEKRCGSCHKLLSKNGGGKGGGNIASNLSGIFSGYFVSSVLKKDEKWDEKKLLKWVENPRSIKNTALMPPVTLTESEKKQLLTELKR